jgi:hypothetical protein
MSRLIEEWMKGTDEERRLRIAAYHEAAHAVACYLLGKRFKYVTIRLKEEKLGKIIYPKKISKPIPSERELRVIKREYMVFLAGPIAEAILSGKCEFEDTLPFIGLPESWTENSPRFNEIFWKLDFVETKLLIYAPWNWQGVMSLADELLNQEKIRYQAARKIIKQAIGDYHEGVRNGISALHHSDYSDFVRRVSDAKVKFKERMRAATLEIMGRRR